MTTPTETQRVDGVTRLERIVETSLGHPIGNVETNEICDYAAALITRQQEEIERRERIEKAATALIADVRSRYPGEDLRCPFMIELDAALEATK